MFIIKIIKSVIWSNWIETYYLDEIKITTTYRIQLYIQQHNLGPHIEATNKISIRFMVTGRFPYRLIKKLTYSNNCK